MVCLQTALACAQSSGLTELSVFPSLVRHRGRISEIRRVRDSAVPPQRIIPSIREDRRAASARLRGSMGGAHLPRRVDGGSLEATWRCGGSATFRNPDAPRSLTDAR